jgi:hypothetical protein
MKFTSLCKTILIPLCLPYSLFIGCSVVGAVVGGAVHPAREGRITSTLGLDSIEIGTQISLVRFDRSTLEGSYKGLAVYPGKLYLRTYDTAVARSRYRGFVPKMNQKITLWSASRSEEGFFKGIDRGELLFQPALESDTEAVSLDEIDYLQASDSARLAGKTARKLVRDGTMPGREVIMLESNNLEERVPYESIEMVEVVRSGSGALAGFLAGAAVDLIAAVLVISAENQAEADCNRTAAGCGSQSCTTSHR